MQRSTKVALAAVVLLFFAAALSWHAVLREERRGLLTVSFLDVGQGDALFIDAPSGRQVLIDGGAGSAAVRRLSSVMPWYDRSIDVVLATHPDQDHIGGLPAVLERYRVGLVVESSVRDEEGSDAAALESAAQAEGARRLVARRGQIFDLGDGAYLEVLFPDRSVPFVETNTGSIVARLVYGDTAFMFTGDSPQVIERYLALLDGTGLRADVLKVGHHGSKTSSALAFVGYVSPAFAVLSRGCDNRYGHPHQDVVALFARLDIPTLDTCTDGTITFVSDGVRVSRQ